MFGVACACANRARGLGRLDQAVIQTLEQRQLLSAAATFSPVASFYTGSGPMAVVVGDFNNDAIADFATADSTGGSVSIRRGRGDGTFRPPTTLAVGNHPTHLVAGDFNVDGKLDLAVAVAGEDLLKVYLGTGDGTTFGQSTVLAAGDLAIPDWASYGTGAKLATGDFDGNGKLDLAVINPTANTVSTFLGAGNGQFADRQVFDLSPYFGPALGIASGDFNADGKTDLAVTQFSNLQVLLSTGSGFTRSQVFGHNPATGTADVLLTDAHDVIAADLTGDGVLDLALVNGGTDDVMVFKGASGGSFAYLSTSDTGSDFGQDRGPNALTAGDFNLDGRLDLAVSNYTYASRAVLINEGASGFQLQETPIYPEDEPYTENALYRGNDIAVGDFNGDGRLDIITAAAGVNAVGIAFNTTVLAFPPAAPSGLSAAANSGTKVTLNWTDNAGNETGFEIQRSGVYNFSSPVTFTVNAANAQSFVDTTVSPSSYYYYRVRTINAAGVSAWSNSVKVKTLRGASAPATLNSPANLTGQAGRTTMQLNWIDHAINETGYQVQLSTVYNYTPASTITVNGNNLQSYLVSGLNPSTWYYFRVRATDGTNFSGWSNSIKLKTLA